MFGRRDGSHHHAPDYPPPQGAAQGNQRYGALIGSGRSMRGTAMGARAGARLNRRIPVADQALTSSTSQVGPAARERRASAVRRGQPNASARAT